MNRELLIRKREELFNESLELSKMVCDYIDRKSRIIKENMKQNNACYVLDNDTKSTIDSLLSMYEDQVKVRSRIQMLDNLLSTKIQEDKNG